MAILKMKKIREMSEKDIEEKAREMQLELTKERASSEVGGTVKSPGRIKEIRRTLARIKTHNSIKKAKAGIAAKVTAKAAEKSKSAGAIAGKEKNDDKKVKTKQRGDGK